MRLRHWVYGLAATPTFTRLDGTDLWYVVLDVPHDSRIEYKIEVIRGDHVESIQDPLNPHTARDPFGANSVLQTDGYDATGVDAPRPRGAHRHAWSPTAATARRSGARSTSTSTSRHGSVRPSRYPLLIVHDGGDYLDYSSMQVVLDNLIHRLELAEIVVAFTNPQDRLVEYADHEPHARYIADELVPWLETEFPLVATPGGRGLMGASFGAAASFAVARRHPGMFGRMLLQSGSFAFSDIGESERGPLFAPIEAMVNAFRADPRTVQRTGLRQLRHLRVADLREPIARAGAAVDGDGGPLCRGPRRAQLGELARPSPRRPVVAVPGTALDGLRIAPTHDPKHDEATHSMREIPDG